MQGHDIADASPFPAGTSLQALLAAGQPLVVPTVFNALSAQVAQRAGFHALYLGAGPLGYFHGGLEANIGLMEVAGDALRIRAVSPLPLLMDGVCGWGDPMHVQRTVAVAQAAGFCAIELEDQWMPKRAHHHVRLEKMVPQPLMEQKIAAAVAARRSPDFLVIGRTNAVRTTGIDDCVRRLEAYHRRGADLLFCMPRTPEEAAFIGARLPPCLVCMPSEGGVESCVLPLADLHALGFRLVLLANPVMAAMYKAMADSYGALHAGRPLPVLAGTSVRAQLQELNDCVGLQAMLALERATVGAT
ncbi:isocitrate lyase/PEP mutase family protein [Ramlibacter sp. AN1015]|uniref:isocitrate lyase/PEP mutase family protein n=1 Tax=Ramlibacter sp. AN1015 TaxID=3133428 RepID=UPI0030C5E667